jgi:hypothetical protein
MLKRWNTLTDELILAEALVYFVFVGAIAVGAAIAVHIF